MAYRNDFVTTAAFTSFTASAIAAYVAAAAVFVGAHIVAGAAASIAACAFAFLVFVAWFGR